MLSGTIVFLAGALALYQLSTLPPWWVFLLLWLPPLTATLCRRLRPFSLLPLLFALGFSLASLDAWQRLHPALPKALEKRPLVVEGRVDSLPRREGRILRFELLVERAYLLSGESVTVPERLRLSWYNDGPKVLAPGQRWRLRVKIKRPHGMQNPGGFDYERWLFERGVGATGYIRSKGDNRRLDEAGPIYGLMRLRHHLKSQITEALDGDPMHGMVTALAIGERSGITDVQWQVLLASGTNHLVAISGLHVGLVAGLVFWLVRWGWRHCPSCALRLAAPRAAALAAMFAAGLYAGLAGFSLPTQRALVMLAVVLGAVWLQRPLEKGRILLLALWAVVLLDPVSVLAPGFWLSFGAVAVILYGMSGRLGGETLWWRWGRVQLLASFGLLPLLLLFFQQGSLSAPLANLVAVPWVSLLVVPLTLLGAMVLPLLPALGGPLLELAAMLLQWLWPLLEWLNSLIPVLPQAVGLWQLVPALAGIAWLFAPHGWPLRGAGAVLLLPLLLWQPARPVPGTANFTLLDVGQGMAAVVETRNYTLLFDSGPRYPSGFNTGDAVVVPFLRSRGRDTVDTLVISHSGNDHAGGVPAVMEQLSVRQVVTGMTPAEGWPRVMPCVAGEQWVRDEVRFELLHPQRRGMSAEENDHSCVLKVTADGQSVLLTADIETKAEQVMLRSGRSVDADILVAPHHGSTTSSTPAFIDAVSPQVVLFSLGYLNRYGFPHGEVVRRYRERGVAIYRTDRAGAIRFVLGDGRLAPTLYRRTLQRLWMR